MQRIIVAPFGATRATWTHASKRVGMRPGCLPPPTAAETEAIEFLRDDFTADQLHTIRAFETPSGFKIDITAVHRFFRLTRYMGGQVSPLSLRLHEWCDTFREDHDAEFIVGGVATGFDWEGAEPSRPHDAPNKIPEPLGDSVDAKIAKMMAAGELIAVPRDAVHTVSPLLVVDKDHSNFVKYRLVHNLSAPLGARATPRRVTPRAHSSLSKPLACRGQRKHVPSGGAVHVHHSAHLAGLGAAWRLPVQA
jgi:hypothetical protein